MSLQLRLLHVPHTLVNAIHIPFTALSETQFPGSLGAWTDPANAVIAAAAFQKPPLPTLPYLYEPFTFPLLSPSNNLCAHCLSICHEANYQNHRIIENNPPRCIAHIPCASRAPQPPPRFRTRHLRLPAPRLVDFSARAVSVSNR